MKQFLMGVVLSALSFCAYGATHHVYATMQPDGSLLQHEFKINNKYTINVIGVGKTASGHINVEIDFHGHNNSTFEVYRLHANGTHKTEDATDPLWNIALRPTVDPVWCSYEEEPGHIHFIDLFHSSLLLNELSTVNSVRYRIFDTKRNDVIDIHINNVFLYDIVTGIEQVTENPQTFYYDLQGMRVEHPIPNHLYIRKVNKKINLILYI